MHLDASSQVSQTALESWSAGVASMPTMFCDYTSFVSLPPSNTTCRYTVGFYYSHLTGSSIKAEAVWCTIRIWPGTQSVGCYKYNFIEILSTYPTIYPFKVY